MYKITLNRVHDTVLINEGNDKLKLNVDGDPMRMVAGLSQAQKLMQGLNDETSAEESRKAALFFAACIFGQEQAEHLLAFYHDDAACVIGVCGQYFKNRLNKLITKAQKKAKK